MSLPAAWDSQTTRRHGMSKTRVYKLWTSMYSRCHIPSATGYSNYGGRGIRVCDRWRVFEAFLSDMGMPGNEQSLDRIDNDGDYEPGNCRWVAPAEQRRHQRDLKYVTIGGEKHCLAVWAARNGVTYDAARSRIARGWDHVRAVTEPVRPHKPYERRAS